MFGWNPDLPDYRDYLHKPGLLAAATIGLPSHVDVRASFPPVFNQGRAGSCVGQAVSANASHARARVGDVSPSLVFSRLYIYYWARSLEGQAASDNGSQIRDAMKVVATRGVCREELWAYSDNLVNVCARPTTLADDGAKWHRAVKYERVTQDLTHLKATLASGQPIAFGFTVYENFMTNSDVANCGHMQMPSGPVCGGHAVSMCGYDDSTKTFLVRNSWGKEWGDGGYFHMPYEYAINPNLADDFWVIDMLNS